MKNFSIIIVLAGIALAGIGICFFSRKSKNLKPWSELHYNQVTEDIFDGRGLLQWVKENKQYCNSDRKILVVKCTKKWVNKLGYEFPEGLDSEHNVIACLMDTKVGETLNLQLFSFGTMDDQRKADFKSSDYFFLEY